MRPSRVLSFILGLLATVVCATSMRAQVSFPGPELLGRPTDHSVTINVVANIAIDAYFEYGTQSGVYTQTYPANGAASPVSSAANVPLVAVLSGLQGNTQYFYKMVYRQSGTTSWVARSEHSFYTQRPAGSTFTFTVGSDSHINIVFGNPSLFQQTLQNIAGEKPDFYVDLGDTFAMDSVTAQAQANSNYLNMRSYFGLISPSVPIFLALGNHEQEEAWHLDDTGNLVTSPPVMSTNARKLYYLNPDPLLDSFYSGNTDVSNSAVSGNHAVEDYYAWQWSDALFVVFDPYWYTTTKPYLGNTGGGEGSDAGSGDRWDWTLGITQYLWLKQTLENSNAKYKFLFAHQVAGGLDDYGRGGANAVPFVEWGGNDDDGSTWDFNTRRAGWVAPVHQLLVDNNVTAVFHGHDHQFAYEKRDGVVYQLVPMSADASYGNGFQDYHETDPYTIRVLPNSGHLRVTVTASQATVDYVRAFLPGNGTNGQVAYSYAMTGSGSSGSTPDFSISTITNSKTVVQGGSTSYAASIGAANGFSSVVSLSVSGLPTGATGTFSPPSITGSGSSSLSVATMSTTPAGTYTLTVTGTSASLTHSTTVTLTVNPSPDFSLSATPSSQTVVRGNSTSYTATVVATNGFNSAVSLSVTGLPTGATGTFSPASVTGSGNSTLNVATKSTTTAGTYTITIKGTSGTLSHAAMVTLVVSAGQANFTLTATPSSQTVVRGNSVSYAATVGSTNGFNSAVSLSVTGLPAGVTGTFSPTSVTGSGNSTLKVTTKSTTTTGTYTLTIRGTSGSLSHTATVTLVVSRR